jgi:ankyrin repeat protein
LVFMEVDRTVFIPSSRGAINDVLLSVVNSSSDDADQIVALVAAGADPNYCSWSRMRGRTLLHLCVLRRDTRKFEVLVKCGADLTRRDVSGLSALHFAATLDFVAPFQCSQGRNLFMKDKSERTSFFWAIAYGSSSVISYLASLTEKALPPLQRELVALREEKAPVLMQGKPLTASHLRLNFDKQSALHVASAVCPQTLEALLSVPELLATVNAPDVAGETAMHKAAGAGHISALKLLIHHNGTVDALDKEKATPLMCACTQGQLEAVRWLLKQGASSRQVDEDGCTALFFAAENGRLKVMQHLLEKERTLSKVLGHRDKFGMSVLHRVAMSGSIECRAVVERVAKSSFADLESALSHSGQTELHVAASAGHLGYVEHVLRLICDSHPGNNAHRSYLECVDNDNLTFMHVIFGVDTETSALGASQADKHRRGIAEALVQLISPDWMWSSALAPNLHICGTFHVGWLEFWAECTATVESKASFLLSKCWNKKPLLNILAAQAGSLSYISEFDREMRGSLWSGISSQLGLKSMGDTFGWNPAHVAIAANALSNLEECIKYLPMLLSQSNREKWLPLHFAAWFNQVAAVSMLLGSRKDSIGIRTSSGKRPVDIAQEMICIETLGYLRVNGQKITIPVANAPLRRDSCTTALLDRDCTLPGVPEGLNAAKRYQICLLEFLATDQIKDALYTPFEGDLRALWSMLKIDHLASNKATVNTSITIDVDDTESDNRHLVSEKKGRRYLQSSLCDELPEKKSRVDDNMLPVLFMVQELMQRVERLEEMLLRDSSK